MPAKDYRLVVSGLMGNVYIAKVSKTNPNLMLSDRREVPVGELYFCIENFAKAKIDDGFSTLEVKERSGRPVFDIKLPNPKLEENNKIMRKVAIETLELMKGFTPEQREPFGSMLVAMELLAAHVVTLTS